MANAGAGLGSHGCTRREFLAGAAAVWAIASAPEICSAQVERTRMMLLGTGGGPRPTKARSASGQVIVSRGLAYVIDCGDGVPRQLAMAGIPLSSLRHIFITHQHRITMQTTAT